MVLTLAAFVVALGLLIVVHEYGHYRVAVACGVKVKRFGIATFPLEEPEAGKASIAYRLMHRITRPIFEWRPHRQHPGQDTVFAVGLFPLGGYVQMLGHGQDDEVLSADAGWAFRNKPLAARFVIVAAGPAANLLLAVLLYALLNWSGVEAPGAILASPVAGSIADAAGLKGGETVRQAAFDQESLEPVRSFEELRWLLTRAVLDGHDVRLDVGSGERGPGRTVLLELSGIASREADARLLRRVGLVGPWTQPLIGDLLTGEAADRAGLRRGDMVLAVGATPVVDGQQLRELIRSSVRGNQPLAQSWRVDRGGVVVDILVTPDVRRDGGAAVGRIGAFVGAAPKLVMVRYGLWDGLLTAFVRTGEVSVLTLRMMGRMVVGEASLKNLSGPLTIADYAGKSASLGLTQYLVFLALVSVSLGVLNLLPLPVLDGGHLMYYLWEAVTGRSVSEVWMDWLQRGGVALLLVMMVVALFNDVTRLLG